MVNEGKRIRRQIGKELVNNRLIFWFLRFQSIISAFVTAKMYLKFFKL
ncbi:hypothetical protein ADIS_0383 [Lunatimonas lonarensis]|uniref:Uncharacterized protein n=1 Tax=Lunatimonas lonarensis TaxID=1232681 RepID=R7ZYM0_9BACT|nr:hypothetical protein ADIS_0383 [Lunatimonas lonarensis]